MKKKKMQVNHSALDERIKRKKIEFVMVNGFERREKKILEL